MGEGGSNFAKIEVTSFVEGPLLQVFNKTLLPYSKQNFEKYHQI